MSEKIANNNDGLLELSSVVVVIVEKPLLESQNIKPRLL